MEKEHLKKKKEKRKEEETDLHLDLKENDVRDSLAGFSHAFFPVQLELRLNQQVRNSATQRD